MKALRIIKCSDSMMWYRDMVGQTVVLARATDCDPDVYWSREPAGYLNMIYKQDADVIEVEDENVK